MNKLIKIISQDELSEQKFEEYSWELSNKSEEYFSDEYLGGSGNEPRIFLLNGKNIIGGIFVNYYDLSNYDEEFSRIKYPYIFDIYIVKKERGKGYSKLLLNAMIEDFVKNFPNSPNINSEVHNLDIVKLLKEYGFKCADVKRRLYHSHKKNYYIPLVLTNMETNEDYIPKDCNLSKKDAIKYLKSKKIKYEIGGNLMSSLEIYPKDANKKMGLKEAIEYCKLIGEGWRLPTVNELRYIYKEVGGLRNEYYWADTVGVNVGQLDMPQRFSNTLDSNPFNVKNVRAVRGVNNEYKGETYKITFENEGEYKTVISKGKNSASAILNALHENDLEGFGVYEYEIIESYSDGGSINNFKYEIGGL